MTAKRFVNGRRLWLVHLFAFAAAASALIIVPPRSAEASSLQECLAWCAQDPLDRVPPCISCCTELPDDIQNLYCSACYSVTDCEWKWGL
jgi:hypothetical protein